MNKNTSINENKVTFKDVLFVIGMFSLQMAFAITLLLFIATAAFIIYGIASGAF